MLVQMSLLCGPSPNSAARPIVDRTQLSLRIINYHMTALSVSYTVLFIVVSECAPSTYKNVRLVFTAALYGAMVSCA